MKPVFLLLLFTTIGWTQSLPRVDREFRAVWVATVDNIDFPTKKDLSVAQQQAELLAILELAEKLRLNAVIFQVRPMTDAVYASKLEPWSEFLTGQMGRPQSFDPLRFLVAEAHKRGILVHAWFNPYRAYHPAAKTISDEHISKTQPLIVRQYGRYMWLDPTDTAAKKHSLKVIKDVVRRYDIDGVHFDDYFYPYAENDAGGKKIEFPDEQNWRDYMHVVNRMAPMGVERNPPSRADWRRSHVNEFIESVGREIKRIKPQIMYGISPFGIWQPMPERQIVGFNAYEELYADARKWLQDGTVDYLAPQLYWPTGRPNLSFPVLLDWWKEQNPRRRHIWPGLATYRTDRPEYGADMIAGQIGFTRRDELTRGAIHFSLKSLRNDLGGIQSKLRDSVYTRDALIPMSPWIRTQKLTSPRVGPPRRDGEYYRASWKPVKGAFQYVVYAKDKDGWSYSIVPAAETSIALSAERKIDNLVVHSVDRLGNTSR